MKTPYEILGAEGVQQLACAFYDAMDELPEVRGIRAMHAQDLTDVKQKLSDYLTGWMGGPSLYQAKQGTVCLTEPHKPYSIGPEETEQWLLCFNKALEKIAASDELKQMLEQPIKRIAAAVQNRQHALASKDDPNIIASC
ncbi:group II truncated hemoglobin [Halioxenophilus aromaticivorans]|uniref:Globin n=1 Tax=Halioxenophilus aromaticivorans TaxID=1306992 RepID=A0AAV3U6E6_9ALTE